MSINPVGASQMNQVAINNNEKKTGGGGKAIASAFVPGLGQFLDGRNKAGATFLLGEIGIGVANFVLQKSMAKDVLKSIAEKTESVTKSTKAKGIGVIVASVAGLALHIAGIVNAYKGDKKAEQPAQENVAQ